MAPRGTASRVTLAGNTGGGWQERGTQLLWAILGVHACPCYGTNKLIMNEQVRLGTSVVRQQLTFLFFLIAILDVFGQHAKIT